MVALFQNVVGSFVADASGRLAAIGGRASGPGEAGQARPTEGRGTAATPASRGPLGPLASHRVGTSETRAAGHRAPALKSTTTAAAAGAKRISRSRPGLPPSS